MLFQRGVIIRRPTSLANSGSMIDSFDGANRVEDLYTLKDKGTAIIRDSNKAIDRTLRNSNTRFTDLAVQIGSKIDTIGESVRTTLVQYGAKTLG